MRAINAFFGIVISVFLSACDASSGRDEAASACYESTRDLRGLFLDTRQMLTDDSVSDRAVYEKILGSKDNIDDARSVLESCAHKRAYPNGINRYGYRLSDEAKSVVSTVGRGEFVEKLNAYDNSSLLENRLERAVSHADKILNGKQQ